VSEEKGTISKQAMNKNAWMTAVAMAVLLPAVSACAQYKPTGEDRVTASPKARKMLSDRAAQVQAPTDVVVVMEPTHAKGEMLVAAPKLQASLTESKSAVPVTVPASTATLAPADGLVTSPKTRELLRGHTGRPVVEVAPITR